MRYLLFILLSIFPAIIDAATPTFTGTQTSTSTNTQTYTYTLTSTITKTSTPTPTITKTWFIEKAVTPDGQGASFSPWNKTFNTREIGQKFTLNEAGVPAQFGYYLKVRHGAGIRGNAKWVIEADKNGLPSGTPIAVFSTYQPTVVPTVQSTPVPYFALGLSGISVSYLEEATPYWLVGKSIDFRESLVSYDDLIFNSSSSISTTPKTVYGNGVGQFAEAGSRISYELWMGLVYTRTASPTITQTFTISPTATHTSTITKTFTISPTATQTSTITVTFTNTPTATPTNTPIIITFNNQTSNANTGLSLTYAHTISGSNPVLIVWALVNGTLGSQTVTYNGSSMTSFRVNFSGAITLSSWILLNPSSGTHNVVISNGGVSADILATALSYNGASLSRSPVSGGSTLNSLSSISAGTTTVSSNSLITDALANTGLAFTDTLGGLQNMRANSSFQGNANSRLIVDDVITTATGLYTLTHSLTSAQPNIQLSNEVKNAP